MVVGFSGGEGRRGYRLTLHSLVGRDDAPHGVPPAATSGQPSLARLNRRRTVMQQTAAPTRSGAERKAVHGAPLVRSDLRRADLKGWQTGPTRMTNVKVPVPIAAVALLLVIACALPAPAVVFGEFFVHGKGFSGLSDPGYAYDYWSAGSFLDQAKGCSGMPTGYSHVDGTRGLNAAFNLYDCGLANPPDANALWKDGHVYSYYGCGVTFTGLADPGTIHSPYVWPLKEKGVVEQIADFLDASGTDDLTVVTHSMGLNVLRQAMSQWGFYDRCFDNAGNLRPQYGTECQRLRNNQLRVNRAITHVLALHGPANGSEAADILTGGGATPWQQLVGFVADWLVSPPDQSADNCTTGYMTYHNGKDLYGTPGRPWPILTTRGETLRVARWIALGSALSPGQNLEDGIHGEDLGLASIAAGVPFAGGWSDGLVSWASQMGVYTTAGTDTWRFSGQHDSAAVAAGGSQYVGNNHWHAKSGAGGRWRPQLWYQQAPAPSTCCGYPNCYSSYGCYGPPTSGWDGIPVAACPDSSCKRNQQRGYPLGGDEAFAISAFVQARAAARCGPALNEISVANGRQYPIVSGGTGGHWVGTTWSCYPGFVCVPPTVIGWAPMYDTYSPNSGLQICNASC